MSGTLYDRLGGEGAVAAVAESFYDRVLGDDRIDHFFENTDVSALRAHQTAFIGSVTGGPVEYDGDDARSPRKPRHRRSRFRNHRSPPRRGVQNYC